MLRPKTIGSHARFKSDFENENSDSSKIYFDQTNYNDPIESKKRSALIKQKQAQFARTATF